MRMRLLIYLLPILGLSPGHVLFAQSQKTAYQYFNLYAQSTYKGSPATEDFLTYVGKLEKKFDQRKNEKQFLKYLFAKTHQRYLKTFDINANFHDLSKKGTYN